MKCSREFCYFVIVLTSFINTDNCHFLRSAWSRWWAAIFGCAALVIVTAYLQERADPQKQGLRAVENKLLQALNQAKSKAPAIAQDFLGQLPDSAPDRVAIDAFRRAAHDAGVAVTSLSLQRTPARTDQLGSLTLTVTAQGSYFALKQLLAEWLGRFPSATVRSQQWRRVEPSGALDAGRAAVEANYVLSVWTRPLGAEAYTKPVVGGHPSVIPAPSSAP